MISKIYYIILLNNFESTKNKWVKETRCSTAFRNARKKQVKSLYGILRIHLDIVFYSSLNLITKNYTILHVFNGVLEQQICGFIN